MRSPSPPGQGGFTLIEVMVALIVLVLGVLGAAAMTLTALRDSRQSGLRSTASALAYEVSDLMRANPRLGAANVFITTSGTAVPTCWTTGCTYATDEMAANDLFEWRRKLRGPNGLPNGDAVICRDSTKLAQYPACDDALTSPLVVKLKWDEKNNNARDAATVSTPLQAVTTRYLVLTIQPN